MMKSITYRGPFKVEVLEKDKPVIEDQRDAILKVTSAAICGSDLHMYEGRTYAEPGMQFGHEIMGVIEEVGSCVTAVKPGDRVVLPFNIACGICMNCIRGFYSACLMTNPTKPSAGYGYAGMGPYNGSQAEYVRVPFADFNCQLLPGKPHDEYEDHFLMLADIFPTGFHANELAMVGPGSIVAIYGAGPVGLLAAHSALIRGASEVYVVDCVPERLEKAKDFGAIPIDFTKKDPIEQIQQYRFKNEPYQLSLKPGESKMSGVLHGIDAVGYEALSYTELGKQNPMQIFENLIELLDYTGHIGAVGVYFPMDPGGVDDNAKMGKYLFPYGMAFEKCLTIAGSQTPVKKYMRQLLDLVISGRAHPGDIVSKHITIDEAPDAYERFDNKDEGYTKSVIKFK